jgi:GT2 family glycosyltransferase
MAGGPIREHLDRSGTGPHRMTGPVTVVVIAYDDAGRLGNAVTSALAQGEAVGEVIVVDDASSDGTSDVADRLADANPRVRVLHRAVNSGGCGTPRNDGMDAARGDWILFLDSDDTLPASAVSALLAAAGRQRAEVAAGLCVRLELPSRRELPWCPELFTSGSVHDGLGARPETVRDTLSVNKLYRREFLTRHGIRFPDGDLHYEDFVFTGRVYAAAPRFAVIPDTVYLWHVHPSAANPSISQRRDRIGNWHDRLAAHRAAVDALSAGGEEALAIATQTKFLSHDLPMYLRDLHRRSSEYQVEWWRSTCRHLGSFPPPALAAAGLSDRWRAAVVLGRARPEEAQLARLAELSAVPPRLAPPYAGTRTEPLWDQHVPPVPLANVATADLAALPLCVSAKVRLRRREIRLRLTLSDLYHRVAEAGPEHVDVELRHRIHGTALRQRTGWHGTGHGGWQAEVRFDAAALRDPAEMVSWDVWATLEFRSGENMDLKVRAGGGLGRSVAVDHRGTILLLQPYATTDRSLAFRVADGATGVRRIVAGRVARLGRS